MSKNVSSDVGKKLKVIKKKRNPSFNFTPVSSERSYTGTQAYVFKLCMQSYCYRIQFEVLMIRSDTYPSNFSSFKYPCIPVGRRTEHNAFTGKGNSWDPYGVARLDLSDLLLGERIIEFSLPIRSCKIPDVLDGKGGGNYSEKIVGKPGNVDGPGEKCMIYFSIYN